VNRKFCYLTGLCLMVLLAGCASGQKNQAATGQALTGDSLNIQQQPLPSPTMSISRHLITPTPSPTSPPQINQPTPTPTVIPGSGYGPTPYGEPPPLTAEELQLTQQLFDLINHDRAVRGLYAFVWNTTLAGGARLHSWNMFHCGFSHTCPDGLNQCARIANEGFTGFTDCGENIGLAGPSNPPWLHVYQVQESMMNEGPSGWHYIHLTSTTLHHIGVGIYVDPNGWVWFTEDMLS